MDTLSNTRFIVGLDVGGTNTDAVIIEYPSNKIHATVKTPTTKDIYSGITTALSQLFIHAPHIKPHQIFALNLGTTAFLNAFLECSDELAPVALFRLCRPASDLLRPFINFSLKLRTKLELKHFCCLGGLEFNKEEISKVCPEEIEKYVDELALIYHERSLKKLNIVISGVFCTLDNYQEKIAEEIITSKLKSMGIPHSITLCSDFPTINIMKREADAIINESLRNLAQKTHTAYNYALKLSNLTHVVFNLVQNNGTLISCKDVTDFPVKTFFSGPTNSLVGASKLANVTDAIIVDIGGTSTDIAILKDGNPSMQSHNTCVAGVPTNLILPNSFSIGLGGGSHVTLEPKTVVGPKSVGYKIKDSTICFGGDQLTTTDVALALQMTEIEGAKKENVTIPIPKLLEIRNHYVKMLESAIDHVKTEAGESILILVGGGSVLIPLDQKIKGISRILRPENFASANAYGAALAGISVRFDKVLEVGSCEQTRQKILQEFDELVKSKIIELGAEPNSIQYLKDDIPLAYMNKVVIRSQRIALGCLNYLKLAPPNQEEINFRESLQDPGFKEDSIYSKEFLENSEFNVISNDIFNDHIIEMNGNRKEWVLSYGDLRCIALGAAILGCGGGGSTYIGLKAIESLSLDNKNLKFRIVSPDHLNPNDAISYIGAIGAPLVQQEKLVSKAEVINCILESNKVNPDVKTTLVGCTEIGGSNALLPLIVGGLMNLPVLDSDCMGRAFPKLTHFLPFIKGISTTPVSISDPKGGKKVFFEFTKADTLEERCKIAETTLREESNTRGCRIGYSVGPLKDITRGMIKYSYSRAWRVGKAIFDSRLKKIDPLIALEAIENAREIFAGNVEYKSIETRNAFNFGRCIIGGQTTLPQYKDKKVTIDFQNEYMIAKAYDKDDDSNNLKGGTLLAIVPDLVVVVDQETFEPIMTSDIKYGMIVRVILIPSVPEFLDEDVLSFAGPNAFGYDEKYVKIPEFVERGSEIPV